jgi:hypothetical protein
MPRRQRFKPSRKPKPAIEPSESEIIPSSPQRTEAAMTEVTEMQAENAEERVPR